MSNINPSNKDLLVTKSDVDAWIEERQEKQSIIEAAQRDILAIDQKLAALDVLRVALGGESELSQKRVDTTVFVEGNKIAAQISQSRTPMPAQIKDIIQKSGGPLLPRHIKRQLAERGVPESQLGNYFYTAMTRLTKRGELKKIGREYAISYPKTKEASEEPSSEASNRDRDSNPVNPVPSWEPKKGGGDINAV